MFKDQWCIPRLFIYFYSQFSVHWKSPAWLYRGELCTARMLKCSRPGLHIGIISLCKHYEGLIFIISRAWKTHPTVRPQEISHAWSPAGKFSKYTLLRAWSLFLILRMRPLFIFIFPVLQKFKQDFCLIAGSLCYSWSQYDCVYWFSLPERLLAQEKSRERFSTGVSYFLWKGLIYNNVIKLNCKWNTLFGNTESHISYCQQSSVKEQHHTKE